MTGNFAEYPESELIPLCRSGNESAYAELARRVALCAQYHLRSLPLSDRDDVSSLVLEKVYRDLGTFDSARGAFATWINTITRNAVINHVRSRRALSSPVSLDNNPDFFENKVASQWDDISHAYIQHARGMVLETIDAVRNDLLRNYLIGKYVMLLDDTFLAGLFEVSEATVRSNLHRALNEFASLFLKRHPALAGIDFKELSNVLKDGAVPITEERVKAIEDPFVRSAMIHVCLDRLSIAGTAEDMNFSSEEIMAAVRKGIPGLLKTKPTRTGKIYSVAEPAIPYRRDTYPQSIEDLILAALSPR